MFFIGQHSLKKWGWGVAYTEECGSQGRALESKLLVDFISEIIASCFAKLFRVQMEKFLEFILR